MTDPSKIFVSGGLLASSPTMNADIYYNARNVGSGVARLSDLDGGEALEAIRHSVNDLLRSRIAEAEAVCEDEPEDEHAFGELYSLKEIQKALDVLFKDMPSKIYDKPRPPHPFASDSFKW